MQEKNVSFNNFEQCIKCTICTAYCPVVAVNPHYPGPKQAGPDGERLRLKNKFFFDENLKYCMNCKRCEVACPSGVKIADLIHSARRRYGHDIPELRDRILASTDFMGKFARPVAPLANFIAASKPAKVVMDVMMDIDGGSRKRRPISRTIIPRKWRSSMVARLSSSILRWGKLS